MDLPEEILIVLYSVVSDHCLPISDLCATIYIVEQIVGIKNIDVYEVTSIGPIAPNFQSSLEVLEALGLIRIRDGLATLSEKGLTVVRQILVDPARKKEREFYEISRRLINELYEEILTICYYLWLAKKGGAQIPERIKAIILALHREQPQKVEDRVIIPSVDK